MKGILIFAAAALVWGGTIVAQPRGLALVGARVITMAGNDLEKGVVLLHKGKIIGVGPRLPVPDGFAQLNLEGQVIMPGMIDLNTYLSGYADLQENVHALTPGIRAGDAFDPFQAGVKKARSSGVTTFALAPRDRNLVGGRVAVVKMPGENPGRGRFLLPAGPFKVSLSRAAFLSRRAPTSSAGAVAMLREALERSRGEVLEPTLNDLAPLGRGEIPAFIHVHTAAEAETAVSLMKEFGLRGCLVHALDVHDAAATLARAKVAVAFGPFTLGLLARQLRGPAALARAGGQVAFVSDAPRTRMADIRVTAVLAVQHGLDRRTALRALTLTAAEILGLQDRVGSLEVGKDADLVVFSGDPLDLASRIERVLVDGRVIHIKKPASGKGVK